MIGFVTWPPFFIPKCYKDGQVTKPIILVKIYYIKLKSHPSVCPHFVVGSISQPLLHRSTSDLLDVIATSSGMTKFIFKIF